MPLMPARVKHRKQQRGNRAGIAWRGTEVSFGEFGLQALDRAWLTAVQIEACRVALSRNMKRRGKLWIRIFPDKPFTKRPPETRMGHGKGNVEGWVAVVRPGTVMSRQKASSSRTFSVSITARMPGAATWIRQSWLR